jgi:hypothetical protein
VKDVQSILHEHLPEIERITQQRRWLVESTYVRNWSTFTRFSGPAADIKQLGRGPLDQTVLKAHTDFLIMNRV